MFKNMLARRRKPFFQEEGKHVFPFYFIGLATGLHNLVDVAFQYRWTMIVPGRGYLNTLLIAVLRELSGK